MKAFDIMRNIRSQVLQGEDVEVQQITIDSRCVSKGSMFFCIPGLRTDGHSYIASAIDEGARAVVVERDPGVLPQDITVFKVANTRRALAYAAANFYHRPAQFLQLVGITGTNGKTSTAYFMEAVFRAWGKRTGLISTVESRIDNKPIEIHFATSTTPDSIELHKIFHKMKEEQVTFAVMEVTSHALALHKVDGIQYEVAIFTNLTLDHLDFHGTFEAYRDAKARLYTICNKAVINIDDENGEYMVKSALCPVTTYSIEKESDLQARLVEYLPGGVRFCVNIQGEDEWFDVPVAGKFSVYNALGAIGSALALGITAEVIREGLSSVSVPGRFQSIPNGRGFSVIVDYAHTPDGLENIITSVREITRGKVITVFGCGGDRDSTKRPIMGELAGKLSDFCIITSDNPRTENPQEIIAQIEPGVQRANCSYEKIPDRKEAIFKAVSMAAPGDAVIIAGKGHENYQIFAESTIHFDDSEVAAEALNS